MNPALRLKNPITKTLKAQLGTKSKFPDGHVVGISFARVFGPKMKTDPAGQPIVISSGPFDVAVETPAHAIARAAKKWHGIEIHEPHWELEMAENVIPHPPGRPVIPFHKLYHFRYLPEIPMWQHKGLHEGNVPNHFRNSYYLTKRWQEKA